ncbi:MAG TPA: demethoxyubiquinone hydroxylase family protein [Burkholderiales bacterium]
MGDRLANRKLKVDHAGEFAAINIYRAQIAVSSLFARAQTAMPEDFLAHEKRHHAVFGALMRQRGQARCRAWLLCGIGGYAPGLTTGLLGANAVLICTFAVEEVVNRHLVEQMRYMELHDPEAGAAVASIVADEQAHQHAAGAQMRNGPLARCIAAIVRLSTESVIWTGMKL